MSSRRLPAIGRRAVFLDRDGTINQDSPDYVKSLAEFRIFDAVPDALRRMRDAGFVLVLITNQSGIARGLMSRDEVERMHAHLRAELERAGAPLLDVALCPHAAGDACRCRKPLPGMIEEQCARHGIDARRSWMIGDKETDVEAGRRAGCRTILLAASRADTRADHVCRDLAAAVPLVTSEDETLAAISIESRESEILATAERAIEAVRAAGFASRGEPRLKLVLIELLANAIEHGNRFDPEREVSVTVRRRGDRLAVSICDQGPGFDDRLLDRDLDAVAVESKRGRGLGLVKKILGATPKAAGGEVTIEFDRARFA